MLLKEQNTSLFFERKNIGWTCCFTVTENISRLQCTIAYWNTNTITKTKYTHTHKQTNHCNPFKRNHEIYWWISECNVTFIWWWTWRREQWFCIIVVIRFKNQSFSVIANTDHFLQHSGGLSIYQHMSISINGRFD